MGKGLAACLAWENLLTRILRLCLSSTQPCLYLKFSTGKCRGKVTLREGFRRCGLEEDQGLGLCSLSCFSRTALLVVFRGNGKNEERNKGL